MREMSRSQIGIKSGVDFGVKIGTYDDREVCRLVMPFDLVFESFEEAKAFNSRLAAYLIYLRDPLPPTVAAGPTPCFGQYSSMWPLQYQVQIKPAAEPTAEPPGAGPDGYCGPMPVSGVIRRMTAEETE